MGFNKEQTTITLKKPCFIKEAGLCFLLSLRFLKDMLLIKLSGVSKNYVENQHSGVDDIDLEIEKGNIISIVGESGSGKTTLLKLIYGYLEPQTGELLFDGKRILGPSEKLIPGHDAMRMVTQDVTLNLYAKVFDNIASQLSNTDLETKNKLTKQTMQFLRIDHLAGKKIVDLSGGEQQRVAIARAIITKPAVLLLDEPFSMLDTILKKQLRDDIERLSKELNITVVMVSHDPSDALSLADKLVVIKEGRIVRQGHPKEIYQNPESVYVAKLLGRANILEGWMLNREGKFAVYPQDIYHDASNSAYEALVKTVHFCGFYNEITYLLDNQELVAYDFNFIPLEAGNLIKINFKELRDVS